MIDLTGAPECVVRMQGVDEHHAVEVLLRLRYCYYVTARPLLSDRDYDCLEWYFRQLFPLNLIINGIGSSNLEDYPHYIMEGRRPADHEREYYHRRLCRSWTTPLVPVEAPY